VKFLKYFENFFTEFFFKADTVVGDGDVAVVFRVMDTDFCVFTLLPFTMLLLIIICGGCLVLKI
jgi:hypothetical protein